MKSEKNNIAAGRLRGEDIPQLVMATNNEHKLLEARAVCGNHLRILSLKDIGCYDDIPETGATLAENALQKARWIKEKYGYDCMADDTGLMVDALDGEPGVYSARYAGAGHDSDANVAKLLSNLTGSKNRKAHFSTVIALICGNRVNFLEGRVDGEITTSRHGNDGFGYDPVFMPDGFNQTFAEMTAEEKNSISHRGRAMRKLLLFLDKKPLE